jgi:hypothetical protein
VVREAQLLGDAYLEGMARTGRRFVDEDTTSNPREQALLDGLARWVVTTPGTTGRRRALPYDVNTFNVILADLEDGTGMSRAAKDCLSSALSREAWRLPCDAVEHAFRHLVPQTREECREFSARLFELVAVVCAHPHLIDTGSFSVEPLRDLLSLDATPALSILVLTWLTATSDGDERVSAAFREFATQVGEAVRPYVDLVGSLYLPIEVFDYLASPRAVEPKLTPELLEMLRGMSRDVTGAVEPRTFLKVVERFVVSPAESASAQARIASFIVDYLTDRGVAMPALDLPSALDTLRRLVDERDGAPLM